MVKSPQETWVRSLGREDPLGKEMATHSSVLAGRTPWTEQPGGPQSAGSQRVGHDRATDHEHMKCRARASTREVRPWARPLAVTPGASATCMRKAVIQGVFLHFLQL